MYTCFPMYGNVLLVIRWAEGNQFMRCWSQINILEAYRSLSLAILLPDPFACYIVYQGTYMSSSWFHCL